MKQFNMGITGQSITLANSIIGVGILAMPFCFQQCGVLLAFLVLIFMGLVSRLCCHFLLKSALIARRRNFEFLAFHVFGPIGKTIVEVGIIGFMMGTCIAYFVVVGDLGPEIISKMFNINQSNTLRTCIMVVVSVACVLPLGLLRHVDTLSNMSAASIGFYFCLVIKVIAEAGGGGDGGGGGRGVGSAEWTRLTLWRPAGLLQCLPIFSMALFCQTQLFEIFESWPSLSLESMNGVTRSAINTCVAVYGTLGLFGYIAFSSQNISGNILMSLSPTMASDVIKLGFVMSIACSFPLVIFPCRASLYSFLYKKQHDASSSAIPAGRFRALTLGIVLSSLVLALVAPGVERVLGLLGATAGVAVCLLFPSACWLRLANHAHHAHTSRVPHAALETRLAQATIVLGLVILVLGTCANLEAETRAGGAGLAGPGGERLTPEKLDQIVDEYFQAKRLKEEQDGMNKPLPKKKIKVQNVISRQEIKDSVMQPPNPVESEVKDSVMQPPNSVESEVKDSIVQPPNQVESEVKTNDVVKPIQEEEKQKEVIEKPQKAEADNTDSHPRNLKSKLNHDVKLVDNEVKIKEKEIKQEEKLNEKAQENIDMMKQQLIETIKQHGEEQKELIKEQKEILDDIKKTKEEIQQNIKERDSDEAKKIAVESIQKIANIAIQSLGGVTDKPVVKAEVENKSEPLNKIANEAVQEIAKKAVESIVAIQDKVKEPVKQVETAKAYFEPHPNAVPIINSNHNQQSAQNIPAKVVAVPSKGVQADAGKIASAPANLVQNNEQREQNNVNGAPLLAKVETIPAKFDGDDIKSAIPALKVHSHSPDEPQSYKEGEYVQVKNKLDQNLNNVIKNLPLAVAMNANSQVNKPADKLPVNNLVLEKHLIRSKREINVATKLTNEEKCDTPTKDSNDNFVVSDPQSILLNVDLNEALRPRVPVEAIIRRSLKSIDETER